MCVCVCVCVRVCACVGDIIVSFHQTPILLFLSAILDISAFTPLYICLEGVCMCVCVCVCVCVWGSCDLGWAAEGTDDIFDTK